MTGVERASGGLKSYEMLGRGPKLLLAYVLHEEPDELQLMRNDPDGQALVQSGWLVEKPSRILGVGVYDFSERGYDYLEQIREHVLKTVSEDELERYKDRKKSTYPWLW